MQVPLLKIKNFETTTAEESIKFTLFDPQTF